MKVRRWTVAYKQQIFLPDRIVIQYVNFGMTLRELAYAYRVSTFTVSKELRRHGVELRRVGRRRKNKQEAADADR